MDGSDRDMQQTDDKQFLLTQYATQQKRVAEGTLEWRKLQEKIDLIVAQRYLEYLNR